MICSQEEVCYKCVAGFAMFNEVVSVHKKKCVIYVYSRSYHMKSSVIS